MTARRAAEAAAWQALDLAVLTVTEQGLRLPCAHRWHEFTADSADTRREAAQLCADCPILEACAGVAPYVSFGVWGGVDRETGGWGSRARGEPRP